MKTKFSFGLAMVAGATLVASALAAPVAQAQDCSRKIGGVLSLTGAVGTFGVPISRVARLAIEQVNEARANLGVGCELVYDVRDAQTQPSVAVDVGQKLIDIDGVTSIVGPVSSGLTGPLLTSVTVEKGVLVIPAASTSPTFTEMARTGATKGLFFRTLPVDSNQAFASAKMAYEAGFRNMAIIHVNNDWGINNAADVANGFKALGGQITNMVAYNMDQPSYRSEVNKAMEGNPDSLYLASTPQDASKKLRDWISLGGPLKFAFALGLNDPELVEIVGEEVLIDGWFISPAPPITPSFKTVNANLQECCDLTINGGPGRTSGHDAGALLALANVAADIRGIEATGANLAKIVWEITGPEGEPVYAGVEGYENAIKLLQEGKDIAFVGVTGPIVFDQFGNVSATMSVQQVRNGQFEEVRGISIEEIATIKEMIASN